MSRRTLAREPSDCTPPGVARHWGMRACLPLLLGGLLCLPAARAEAAPEQHAGYDIYALGVPVAVLSTGFVLGPSDYQIDLSFRTTGLVGWLFRGHQQSGVEGQWRGDLPTPRRFAGEASGVAGCGRH